MAGRSPISLIFILRKLSAGEISHIRRNFPVSSALLLFESSLPVPSELIGYRKEVLDKQPEKNFMNFMRQCFREINEFGAKRINENIIIDHLTAEKSTMWFYLRPIVLLAYRSALIGADKILSGYRQFEKESVSGITVFGFGGGAKYFLPHYVQYREFPGDRERHAGGKLFNYLLLFTMRLILSLFQLPGALFRQCRVILFDDPKHSQQVIDLSTLQSVPGDSYTGYLKQKASKEKGVLILSELFIPNLKKESLPLSKEVLFARFSNTLNYEVFVFLTLINPVAWFRIFRFSGKLASLYKSIGNQTSLPKEKILAALLQDAHRLSLVCYFRELSARLFFNIFRPSGIGGDHEHELKNKPLITVARQKQIRTFGIQHGIFNEFHYHYTYAQEDIPYMPIPDFTILWGSKWKKTLIEHSIFTDKNVTVLGQVRTDCIPLLKTLSKKDVLPWLEGNKPLVLFATQHFLAGETHMQEKIIDDFFQLASEMPHVEFIIKPHPFETDLNIYSSPIKKLPVENVHIVEDDVYKLIAVSDIVFVYSSTVGTETVYFKKPLVVLDYFNNDFMQYVKQQVAFRASSYTELKLTVEGVLNGKLKLDENIQAGFIEENVLMIDGKVCERYTEFIKSL